MALDIYLHQILPYEVEVELRNNGNIQTLTLNLDSQSGIEVYEMAKQMEVETGKQYIFDFTSNGIHHIAVHVKIIDSQSNGLKDDHSFHTLYSEQHLIVFTNDLLNTMAAEFVPEAPVHSWVLDNDKFVVFQK